MSRSRYAYRLIAETYEAGILDAVALGRCGREQNTIRKLLFRLELYFVVGPGQHPDPCASALGLPAVSSSVK